MSLLEDLAERSGCDYLSDLKRNANWRKVLLTVEIYRYDIDEWNDAVSYLTKKAVTASCIDDAVKILLDYDCCRTI